MSETILIVDDERAIAQLTALWVTAAGYKPLVAHDGEAALAAAAAHKPQLILLDIRMPNMDGFEVNRRLKLIPELTEIPVIFLSAHAQESARQLAISVGAAAFLSKPYEARDLTTAITTVLAKHKSK
ncbi:MAG: multi-sensor signal transduction histidine kinase [Phycisphaerales bacterium]|nr:multi-sensor signal transduction histidine kinase [Phycisphaerales bacterium]